MVTLNLSEAEVGMLYEAIQEWSCNLEVESEDINDEEIIFEYERMETRLADLYNKIRSQDAHYSQTGDDQSPIQKNPVRKQNLASKRQNLTRRHIGIFDDGDYNGD